MSMKNPLTPAGIEPATFRFVAQHSTNEDTYWNEFGSQKIVLLNPLDAVNILGPSVEL